MTPAPVRRVTLRDVALAAGCHYSTVSLALRDHPRLPAETRERVRRVARQLGYVADPLLSSLSSYRTARRPPTFHSNLAWITNHPTADGWREADVFHHYYLGAEERARALGYSLEIFWMRERGMTPARASQILRSRNITGLLISPQPGPGGKLELDWPSFSAVALGYTLASPGLHLVSTHQYRSIKLALQRLAERGYQRIGLVMPDLSDARVDRNWLAGYLVAQQALPLRQRVPHLFPSAWDENAFGAWLRRHRPDAIVTKNLEVLPALRRLRRRVPEDLGVAFLTLPQVDGRLSGIDENPREVGAAAADYLAGMIHRNERGVPAMPQRVLIDGSWIEGSTVRPATRTLA
ncbi:MAG: LacI family DNA-binding transcriptional regulator [Verrucomicrobia bacterium]|nr:LacI family DNA-binding transcriptional regulator [Verrucomicrobiota bacterium]